MYWTSGLLCLSLAACAAAPLEPAPADAWSVLFDGTQLESWVSTPFGGEGEVELRDDGLRLPFGSMLTGVHWTGADLPASYELEVVAARLSGTDFFCALTLPIGEEFATLVLGGWGGALVGLSCVDGADASENSTRSIRAFENGVDYLLRVRVDAERIAAWVDGELLFDQARVGHSFAVRPEVLLSRPLGIASFATTARIGSIRMRALGPERGL